MKDLCFHKATFLCSCLEREEVFYNQQKLPMFEIALAGRSNVGKSSLINHLTVHKKLAKVSPKPGKTQTINYFSIDDEIVLVDLPGYGYACADQKKQKIWSQAIDHYLRTRHSLVLLLLLIDIRREISLEDRALLDWAEHHQKRVLIIFTKSDTLNPFEREKELKRKLSMMSSPHYLFYSVKESVCRKKLIESINRMLKHVFGE